MVIGLSATVRSISSFNSVLSPCQYVLHYSAFLSAILTPAPPPENYNPALCILIRARPPPPPAAGCSWHFLTCPPSLERYYSVLHTGIRKSKGFSQRIIKSSFERQAKCRHCECVQILYQIQREADAMATDYAQIVRCRLPIHCGGSYLIFSDPETPPSQTCLPFIFGGIL
jgi:hypothetical protein